MLNNIRHKFYTAFPLLKETAERQRHSKRPIVFADKRSNERFSKYCNCRTYITYFTIILTMQVFWNVSFEGAVKLDIWTCDWNYVLMFFPR